MSRTNNNESSANRVQRLQFNLIIIVITIILTATFFLTGITLSKTNEVVSKEVSELIAANSRQLQLNINSYLENVERTSALLFSDESYYLYDATDESIEDYDRIQSEALIVNRIVDLGMMENFSDFGLVYSNDHYVGWISNTTQNLYPEGGIYDGFSAYTKTNKTEDGWIFGIENNLDRMYYTKRLNPNAILIASFYITELNTVFQYPDELKGMTIYLIDDNNTILYATDKEQIGANIPTAIESLIGSERTNVSARNEELIVNSNTCKNGWRVVCSVSTASVMKDINSLRNFTIAVTVLFAVISIVAALILIRKVTKPVDSIVTNLEEKATIDTLSGLYNKAYFKEQTEYILKKAKRGHTRIFIIIDMDNFKSINDTYGHDYGDQVISRMGKLLSDVYGDKHILGRIGGDEFALSEVAQEKVNNDLTRRINTELDELMTRFSKEFATEKKSCDISLSIGVSVTESSQFTYTDLYKQADKALYNSKNNGKNQYNYYTTGGDDYE